PHRHVGLQHRIQLFTLTFSHHPVGHGRLDHARADGVNANATRCIFEGGALGESDHSMLCGVVGPAPDTAYKSPKRRAIDDGSTFLLAHLSQLELHATPYAAEIDRHHLVVIVTRRISSFRKNILNARIVVSGIELSESGD